MEVDDDHATISLKTVRRGLMRMSAQHEYRDLEEREGHVRTVNQWNMTYLILSCAIFVVMLSFSIAYLVFVYRPSSSPGHPLQPERAEFPRWLRRIFELGAVVLICVLWWKVRKHRVQPPSGSFFSTTRIYLLVLAIGTVLWHGTMTYELWDTHRGEAVASVFYALGALIQLSFLHWIGHSDLSISFKDNRSVLHLLTFAYLVLYNVVLCLRDLAVDYTTGDASCNVPNVVQTMMPTDLPSGVLTSLSILSLAAMIDFRLHCAITAAEQLMHRLKRSQSVSSLAQFPLLRCQHPHGTVSEFKKHLQKHTVHQGSDWSFMGLVIGLVPCCSLALILNFGGAASTAPIGMVVIAELLVCVACVLLLVVVRPQLHSIPDNSGYTVNPAIGIYEFIYFWAIAALLFLYVLAVHVAQTAEPASAALLSVYLEIISQVVLISILCRGHSFMHVRNKIQRALGFACLHYLFVINIGWSLIYLVLDPELLCNDLDSAGVAITIHFHFLAATLIGGTLIGSGLWTRRSLTDSRSDSSWWRRAKREEVLRLLPEASEWFKGACDFGHQAHLAEESVSGFEFVHRSALWDAFIAACVEHGLLEEGQAEGEIVSFIVENETLLEDLFGVPWAAGISRLMGEDQPAKHKASIAHSLFKNNQLLPIGMVAVSSLSTDSKVVCLGYDLGIPLVSAGGSVKQNSVLELYIEEGKIMSKFY